MDDMDGSEDDGDDDNGVADDDDDDQGRASQRGLLGLKMTVQHGRSRPQAGSGAELNAIGLPESAQWRTHQDGASYSRQATRILKSTPARPQGHMFVHCKLKQCHPLKLSKSIISVLMFLFHSKIVFTSIVASRIVNKIEPLPLCGIQDVRPTPTPLIWKW